MHRDDAGIRQKHHRAEVGAAGQVSDGVFAERVPVSREKRDDAHEQPKSVVTVGLPRAIERGIEEVPEHHHRNEDQVDGVKEAVVEGEEDRDAPLASRRLRHRLVIRLQALR